MPFEAEKTYRRYLKTTLAEGVHISSRNGETLSINNTTIRADCRSGVLPLLLGKTVAWKTAIHELIWMLKGETSVEYLHENNVHIWDLWAKEGELGPIYGAQWARQLSGILYQSRNDPFSRRLLVNSWQLDDLDEMNLVPCHYAFQILNYPVSELKTQSGKVVDLATSEVLQTDIVVTMRSSDAFLGMPFNLIGYSVLLNIISSITNTIPGYVYINSGNFHIYKEHIPAVLKYLKNQPAYSNTKEATLSGTYYGRDFEDLAIENFQVNNYRPQFGRIRAPLHA
jgi:thymidylate synthase